MLKKFTCGAMVVASLLATGCTGSFELTKKLNRWQTSFNDKWVDEVAFLGCVVIPVYGLAALADAIVFNSVEFWTGNNPVLAKTIQVDGKDVLMVAEGNTILIESEQGRFSLERDDDKVMAKNADGELIYYAMTGADQKVSVYDAHGSLLQTN